MKKKARPAARNPASLPARSRRKSSRRPVSRAAKSRKEPDGPREKSGRPVLIFLPRPREKALVENALSRASIRAEVFDELDQLAAQISEHSGAVLLAEEAFTGAAASGVTDATSRTTKVVGPAAARRDRRDESASPHPRPCQRQRQCDVPAAAPARFRVDQRGPGDVARAAKPIRSARFDRGTRHRSRQHQRSVLRARSQLALHPRERQGRRDGRLAEGENDRPRHLGNFSRSGRHGVLRESPARHAHARAEPRRIFYAPWGRWVDTRMYPTKDGIVIFPRRRHRPKRTGTPRLGTRSEIKREPGPFAARHRSG